MHLNLHRREAAPHLKPDKIRRSHLIGIIFPKINSIEHQYLPKAIYRGNPANAQLKSTKKRGTTEIHTCFSQKTSQKTKHKNKPALLYQYINTPTHPMHQWYRQLKSINSPINKKRLHLKAFSFRNILKTAAGFPAVATTWHASLARCHCPTYQRRKRTAATQTESLSAPAPWPGGSLASDGPAH